MTVRAPTEAQLRAQVASILEKSPGAVCIGIQSPAEWTGPGTLDLDGNGTVVDLVWCPSALAVREELQAASGSPRVRVILTDRPESDLGLDVLSRLERCRLFQIDPWSILRDLFRAHDIDPALRDLRWMAEGLIEARPAGGYAAVAGGSLSADRAWGEALRQLFDFREPRPSARHLLECTLTERWVDKFRSIPDQVRSDVSARLEETAGPVGALVLAAMRAGHGPHATSLGLVCRLLGRRGDDDPERKVLRRDGRVRMERYIDDLKLTPEMAERWADVAEDVVQGSIRAGTIRTHSRILDRADALVRDLALDPLVGESAVLRSGLEDRISDYVRSVDGVDEQKSGDGVGPFERPLRRVLEHALVKGDEGRVCALQMSARLARCLWTRRNAESRDREAEGLEETIRRYVHEGCYADWARHVIHQGEEHGALRRAFASLGEQVRELREAENRRFGEMLARERGEAAGPGVVAIEDVLDSCVAQLAKAQRVLLIVLDGVSHAVLKELMADLDSRGWIEIAPKGVGRRTAVAVVPSVTEFSRTSLLCGRLTRGGQDRERAEFAEHAGLKAASGGSGKPVLYHKDGLSGVGGGLDEAVQEKVRGRRTRIVGVVLNAVDDHLSKGDQVHVGWSSKTVPLLGQLLEAARVGGRCVVLASDHGHVYEWGLTHRDAADGGDRWRPSSPGPGEGEVLVKGKRVLAGGSDGVVVPWSERVRYAGKKHGYHGGITLQEMLVPVVVLKWNDQEVEGWDELPDAPPEWWEAPLLEEDRIISDVEPAALVLPPIAPHPPPVGQGRLFGRRDGGADGEAGAAGTLGGVATDAGPDEWLTRLMGSQQLQDQVARTGKGAVKVSDERLTQVLRLLDARGGQMTTTSLARELGIPRRRVSGLVASIGRLLNLEGIVAIRHDPEADRVELNRPVLNAQFGLE